MINLAQAGVKLSAFRQLIQTSDEDFDSFMSSYNTLFIDSPENTKEDYDQGVPMEGYRHGSSDELALYYKFIH